MSNFLETQMVYKYKSRISFSALGQTFTIIMYLITTTIHEVCEVCYFNVL